MKVLMLELQDHVAANLFQHKKRRVQAKHQNTVAITYRVHDFENFDENFVQGTISPLLKSHIPLDGSVSLFKYLPTELKRI